MGFECGYSQLPNEYIEPRAPHVNQALLYLPEVGPLQWRGVTGECSMNCLRPVLPSSCAIVDSNFLYHLELTDSSGDVIARKGLDLGSLGVYNITSDGSSIQMDTLKDPATTWNQVGPFLAVLGFIVLAAVVERLWNAWAEASNGGGQDDEYSRMMNDAPVLESQVPEKHKESANKRLRSLDTFRGISLVLMMFVNYGGGGYWCAQTLSSLCV